MSPSLALILACQLRLFLSLEKSVTIAGIRRLQQKLARMGSEALPAPATPQMFTPYNKSLQHKIMEQLQELANMRSQ
jgi:hypothetical protein